MRLRQPQGEGWRGKEGRGVGRWRTGEQKAGKGETGSGPEGKPRPGTRRGREAELCWPGWPVWPQCPCEEEAGTGSLDADA